MNASDYTEYSKNSLFKVEWPETHFTQIAKKILTLVMLTTRRIMIMISLDI